MSIEPSRTSPTPLSYGVPVRPDLRQIAIRQRALVLSTLTYLALFLSQFGVLREPRLMIILQLCIAGASITAAIFVALLAAAGRNTRLGIVLAVVSLIPIVGLVVLVSVNSWAPRVLRRHGLRVGLLGVNPGQIPTASLPR